VSYANFKVTVLGEVAKPAAYTVANEKVSVLDALGMAGDLTIHGKRENLLLIRTDSMGRKEYARLNLNSSEIFESPYFYLRQNDVLYVEPTQNKMLASDAKRNRIVTVGASVVSAILVLLIRVI
jgi:polysaccharide export outer membrane protein